MKSFVIKRFRESNIDLLAELGQMILTEMDTFPHFTQLLCLELWVTAKLNEQHKITEETVTSVINHILSQENNNYEWL